MSLALYNNAAIESHALFFDVDLRFQPIVLIESVHLSQNKV